ncbi:MAG: AAA family ATPase [Acidobacteria bacterium]|nr:AAA family ATPase [Acidobacteriota bacterium]
MINRLAVKGFKSFRDVTVHLGGLNLFVGTNASGKSNFFDALRVLQGIGNGFTVSEILDGKPRSATSEVWEGIRGGSAKACFEGADQLETFSITAAGRLSVGKATRRWEYSVSVSPSRSHVERESLEYGGRSIYDSRYADRGGVGSPVLKVEYQHGGRGRPRHLPFERSRPVLRQFEGANRVESQHGAFAARVANVLADMQRVDPAPTILRDYAQAGQVARMGEHGENFAALVRGICADPDAEAGYLEWLRELRPAEVDSVATLSGAVGEPLFMLREGGREFPAPVLSDGTLRFAAIAAAFFQPDMPRIMTIEEIENGIHASRTRLILELLRANAEAGSTQILATTHSPAVLAWLEPPEYATTHLCRRDQDTGEATITRLRDVPGFGDVARDHSLGDLFTEGWLEASW